MQSATDEVERADEMVQNDTGSRCPRMTGRCPNKRMCYGALTRLVSN